MTLSSLVTLDSSSGDPLTLRGVEPGSATYEESAVIPVFSHWFYF